MNIFVLDSTPSAAARAHCNRHVVKMILESAQMLSTCHEVMGTEGYRAWSPSGPASLHGYPILRPSHRNHPCNVWLRAADSNYDWLHSLALNLCSEYTRRYGKVHRVEATIRGPLALVPPALPVAALTPHAQAMPKVYRADDAVLAYRLYYIGMKMHFAKWPDGLRPVWVDEYFELFDRMELPYARKGEGRVAGRQRATIQAHDVGSVRA